MNTIMKNLEAAEVLAETGNRMAALNQIGICLQQAQAAINGLIQKGNIQEAHTMVKLFKAESERIHKKINEMYDPNNFQSLKARKEQVTEELFERMRRENSIKYTHLISKVELAKTMDEIDELTKGIV